ncbi:sporulation delaying protein family toxin [Halalkalibacter sp. AB-rgal2]|uniref:sporulation delaying protein family toxin n=1 Tax=Halalkalibacter TaxID=2893056 RepID=UPI00130E71A0|nr:sporulation delaying protein family toxin [Halalkalibacter hemicellulosilyticus]
MGITLLLVTSLLNPAAIANGQKFEGEQLFRAIFFGQGEAAELFEHITQPELVDYEHTEEELELISELVNGVDKLDETLFDRLEQAIYSKNLVDVHKILQEASMHSYNVLEKIGYDIYANNGDGEGEIACVVGPVVVIAAGVYMYVAAAHTAAVGIQVGVGAAYWVSVGAWVTSSVDPTMSLEQERIVVEVVEAIN